jgi:ubiquinone/menaquinone biosynthesis C-methylase UbiE
VIRLSVVSLWVIFPGVSIWIELLLLIVTSILLYVFVLLKIVRRYLHFPAPSFIGRGLDSRPRKKIQPPAMLVEALDLENGMSVLEIGCGPGTFTLDVARAVAPDGCVYAVDVQEGMLDQLRRRIETESISNITPVLADAEGRVPLEDGKFDRSFAVCVVPEIPDRAKALREVRRLLKDGGLFGEAEFVLDPDWPLPRTARKWAKEAGFVYQGMAGNVLRYVLIFSK